MLAVALAAHALPDHLMNEPTGMTSPVTFPSFLNSIFIVKVKQTICLYLPLLFKETRVKIQMFRWTQSQRNEDNLGPIIYY